jgi:enoyl-CoA hydratase
VTQVNQVSPVGGASQAGEPDTQPPPLRSQLEDGVLTLTLNRPEKRNALDWATLRALEGALAEAAGEDGVRCVVLRGAGERAFCAGADLRAVMELTPETARRWVETGHRVLNTLVALPQPVIAAVRGYALGGGLELALACDIRVLGDDARLGLPEVTRGWTPGWGGPRRLRAIVGPARAAELALIGEPIDAPTARAWGLAQRVVPAGALDERVAELAALLAGRDRDAVRAVKTLLVRGDAPGDGPLLIGEAEIRRDADDLAAFVRGPAFRAAIERFLAGRPAKR